MTTKDKTNPFAAMQEQTIKNIQEQQKLYADMLGVLYPMQNALLGKNKGAFEEGVSAMNKIMTDNASAAQKLFSSAFPNVASIYAGKNFFEDANENARNKIVDLNEKYINLVKAQQEVAEAIVSWK